MTTGDQIRTARERAGLTQHQLGVMLGVSMRTVGNWEREASVPRNKLGAIQHLLDGQSGTDAPALRDASDAELLAEIARRFARHTEGGGERARSAPKTEAPGTGATATHYDLAADAIAAADGLTGKQRFTRRQDAEAEAPDPAPEGDDPA